VQQVLTIAGKVLTPARQRAPAFAGVVGEIAAQERAHSESLQVDQVPQTAVTGIPGVVTWKWLNEHIVQVRGAKTFLMYGPTIKAPSSASSQPRRHPTSSVRPVGPTNQCAGGLPCIDVVNLNQPDCQLPLRAGRSQKRLASFLRAPSCSRPGRQKNTDIRGVPRRGACRVIGIGALRFACAKFSLRPGAARGRGPAYGRGRVGSRRSSWLSLAEGAEDAGERMTRGVCMAHDPTLFSPPTL